MKIPRYLFSDAFHTRFIEVIKLADHGEVRHHVERQGVWGKAG
jgi:hypothetical protein